MRFTPFLLAVLWAGAAQAACLSDAEVSAMFDAYNQRLPAANPQGLNSADGECPRGKFNRMLELQLGQPIGYKAGPITAYQGGSGNLAATEIRGVNGVVFHSFKAAP